MRRILPMNAAACSARAVRAAVPTATIHALATPCSSSSTSKIAITVTCSIALPWARFGGRSGSSPPSPKITWVRSRCRLVSSASAVTKTKSSATRKAEWVSGPAWKGRWAAQEWHSLPQFPRVPRSQSPSRLRSANTRSSSLDSHARRANVALMPTRTIAYLRVSTDKQADRGVSLDVQRAKAKVYAELYDLELLEVIVDAGESAKALDRPGLQRALGMLKRGEAEAMLVVKLDRLTPSVPAPRHLATTYFAPAQ